ncbi:MAG: FKBP-type peptidyl-prolyl cis-trans isomerase [Salinivirgaceae bacterium]|nr:FKBP-type peptidyl-prolyl cis-trans isomerase [Salinivirgaceae bacterium]
MKIKNLLIAVLFGGTIFSCTTSNNGGAITTEKDSVSYFVGNLEGDRIRKSFEMGSADTLINFDLYIKAFTDGSLEKEFKMDPDSNEVFIQNFIKDLRAAMQQSQTDSTFTTSAFRFESSRLDSVSYLLGANMGKYMTKNFKEQGIDTILEMKLMYEGFVSTIKKEALRIDAEDKQMMVRSYFIALQEADMMNKFGENKAAGEEFLAKNKALEAVTVTASGLQYEVLKEGNGVKAAAKNTVKVHYHGTLVDGTVFESTVEKNEPATFGVTQVIPGWIEGLQLMSVGSKYKFFIPYDLAYGTRDQGNIKPYSMLIFEIELLEIVK